MCAISARQLGAAGGDRSPPNIRWSTKRSSACRSRRRGANRTRRCRSGTARRRAAPASARSSRGGRGGRRRCRAGARGTCPAARPPTTSRPVRRRGEVVGTGEVPADRTGVEDLHGGEPAADDVARRGRAGRPRPRGARARARLSRSRRSRRVAGDLGRIAATELLGDDLAVGRLGGLLLGLLLGAALAAAVEVVADPHLRGERLGVVGAVVLDDVLRARRGSARRDSSWRLVFQSRPAPSPAALAISGSNSRCTTSPATSKPPLR